MNFGFLIVAFFCFSLCFATEENFDNTTNKAMELITNGYDGEINDSRLKEGMLRGMLESLDPYSGYFSPDDLADFMVNIEGKFVGIGAEMLPEKNGLKIISCIEDSPAAKAGLLPNDYIVEIDDKDVATIGFVKAISLIRGTAGTNVKLKILRPENLSTPLTLNITREDIVNPSVKSKLIDDQIMMIQVSSFINTTTDDIKNIFKKPNQEIKGVIIDLRNNPGGTLEQAVGVANLFLNKGVIVSIRGRNKSYFYTHIRPEINFGKGKIQTEEGLNEITFSASEGTIIPNSIPMVVIINRLSASAAEIVAAALKDNNRAILVGETSFGKGSVQQLIPINEGKDGAIKITTAKYYTPHNVSIHEQGVVPHVNVENSSSYRYNEEDRQLFAALITIKGLISRIKTS